MATRAVFGFPIIYTSVATFERYIVVYKLSVIVTMRAFKVRPMVQTLPSNDTIDTNGITYGTIGISNDTIGIPMSPLVKTVGTIWENLECTPYLSILQLSQFQDISHPCQSTQVYNRDIGFSESVTA